CGPKPMLKALEKVTSESGVPMKVLLEKRMGCGIGVCMSCVCRTKKNDEEGYSRVCMEGPLFDSKDIDWEKL
ncbi:MAG: dihydroorotate dehydrogenase electron transfer subunit, partial [Deltaproteobacteria bacterium]|nr:dihydroorotate dehydrogenase electron transfer subunit [Deltaproteobacteria bacterium]